MRFGPLYVLRFANWLRLCRQLEELRQEQERLQRLLENSGPAGIRSSVEDILAIPRAPEEGAYVEPPAPTPSKLAMFQAVDGWTCQFEIDGQTVGGPIPSRDDDRLPWLLDAMGGVAGKRVLELGPLDGAHTQVLLEQGAREVIAIEGFRPAWLRCLVVKEIFRWQQAQILYGDFCAYVADYQGPPFDLVLASGVLYHQRNPARLIHDLARITDQVLVWSQVADARHPHGGTCTQVHVGQRSYEGRCVDYQGVRNTLKNYCGGVHPTTVWLFADELRRAFVDAGFVYREERPTRETPYGPSLLFVASKTPLRSVRASRAVETALAG
jgi:hypothetical protein